MNRLINKNLIQLLSSPLNTKFIRVSAIRGYADGFTYLFPDVPSDTASENYLLNIPRQGELINFKKIDPNQSFRAVLKTLFELEGCCEEITNLNYEDAKNLTFDQLYNEIDDKLAHLNYAYTLFDLMFTFRTDKFQLRKGGNTKLVKAYNDIRSSLYKSSTIFKLMLNLDKQQDKLTDHQKLVVRRYIIEGVRLNQFKLNSLHLEHDLAVDQYKKLISKYSQDYIDNVNTHSTNFVQKVINADYVKTVPNYLKHIIEGKSKVNLHFSPAIYDHFLSNCDDQHERYNYWFEYNNRSSLNNCDRKVSNNIIVDEIIYARRKLAKRLGFINFIEYVLQSRTLDSIVLIKELLIEKLFDQTRDKFRQDLTEILKFASNDLNFKSTQLNPWDLPYFLTKFKNQNMANYDKEISFYFPVPKVIDGILKFLTKNLNCKFEKLNIIDKLDHPLGDSIEYYSLYHNDKFVGNFYMNLYSKIRTPHVRNITDKCDQLDVTPIVGLFLNYDKPFEGQNLTMSFNEVVNVFRSFGFILDHLLPKNGYAEVSGANSLNKDFRELTANLFTLFAMHDYDTLKECSQHVFTGEQLSKDLHHKLIEGILKFKSIHLTEEIYKQALDFAFYTQEGACIDINREIYNKYMNPFEFGKENNHICSSFDLIVGNNVGAFYSKLYSEILAADLFVSQYDDTDSKCTNEERRFNLLNSYVNNFLLNDKGVNDLEPFRKLRGRDFSIKPFLTLNKLIRN